LLARKGLSRSSQATPMSFTLATGKEGGGAANQDPDWPFMMTDETTAPSNARWKHLCEIGAASATANGSLALLRPVFRGLYGQQQMVSELAWQTSPSCAHSITKKSLNGTAKHRSLKTSEFLLQDTNGSWLPEIVDVSRKHWRGVMTTEEARMKS
jgi:hypothetical protein